MLPSVGQLQALTIGHNNKGPSPDWNLEMVEVGARAPAATLPCRPPACWHLLDFSWCTCVLDVAWMSLGGGVPQPRAREKERFKSVARRARMGHGGRGRNTCVPATLRLRFLCPPHCVPTTHFQRFLCPPPHLRAHHTCVPATLRLR